MSWLPSIGKNNIIFVYVTLIIKIHWQFLKRICFSILSMCLYSATPCLFSSKVFFLATLWKASLVFLQLKWPVQVNEAAKGARSHLIASWFGKFWPHDLENFGLMIWKILFVWFGKFCPHDLENFVFIIWQILSSWFCKFWNY